MILTNTETDAFRPIFKRKTIKDDLSKKFILGSSKNSSRQYYEMYSARLKLMRSSVERSIKNKWSDIKIKRLHELDGDKEDCAVIGTLSKIQELKPSILKEFAEENQLIPQPVLEKFVSENDEIVLEDELQRIYLKGNINIAELVTGIVCGVKGHEEAGGKFWVTDICFAELSVLPQPIPIQEDKFLLLVSGLELEKDSEALSLQLLVDYITGHLTESSEQINISSIVKVIIAGNSIGETKDDTPLSEKFQLIKTLDNILVQLASSCPIDLMPGEYDPANHVIPQQPFHHCLFPQSSRLSSMHSVTNPYECDLEGVKVVGSCGENVRDISQCTSLDEPLLILSKICEWGHLAPSAPDTLLSYPYQNIEPFIMDSLPDILFAGNQDKFAYQLIQGNRPRLLLSIPKFRSTKTCILVNLKTFDVLPLCFDCDSTF